MKRPWLFAAAAALLLGCNSPKPNADPFALGGPRRIPPPSTGSYGQPANPYYPTPSPGGAGASAAPGAAPSYAAAGNQWRAAGAAEAARTADGAIAATPPAMPAATPAVPTNPAAPLAAHPVPAAPAPIPMTPIPHVAAPLPQSAAAQAAWVTGVPAALPAFGPGVPVQIPAGPCTPLPAGLVLQPMPAGGAPLAEPARLNPPREAVEITQLPRAATGDVVGASAVQPAPAAGSDGLSWGRRATGAAGLHSATP